MARRARSSVERSRKWYEVTAGRGAELRENAARMIPIHWSCYATDDDYQRAVRQAVDARRAYREWILGWFWCLVAPIGPGECVPNEVAALLAEQWDMETGAVTLARPDPP